MNHVPNDAALLSVLMERYEKQRLPRAQALKARVERGEPLTDFDIHFLKDVSDSINGIKSFLVRHPGCCGLATQLLNLCTDIAKQGLAQENTR